MAHLKHEHPISENSRIEAYPSLGFSKEEARTILDSVSKFPKIL